MITTLDTIDINCEIHARSELGIMIHDGQKTVWLPRSEIIAMSIDETAAGHPRATLTIPGWIAREKYINISQVDNSTADLFGEPT